VLLVALDGESAGRASIREVPLAKAPENGARACRKTHFRQHELTAIGSADKLVEVA